MNKKGVIFLILFIFVFVLVVAQEESQEIDQEFVDDFFKNPEAIPQESIDAANKDKEGFIRVISEKTGISDLSKLEGKIDKIDAEGNMVLSNGHKIPLKKIYDYSTKINDGDFNPYKYDFNGEEFEADHLAIDKISVDGDNLVYEFKNGGTLVLSEDANYDPSTRMITDGSGKTAEWVGMNGEIVVGDTMKLNVIYEKEGDDALENFPLLKTEDGTLISPHHKVVTGVDIPTSIDPSEITKGKFRSFDANGKKYVVNSEGIVREMSDSSVGISADGLSGSNIFVSKEGYGKVFLGEDMNIYFGGSPPSDSSENYIYIGDLSDGKRDIAIRSKNGETYYELDSEIGKLTLEGEVYIKNGGIILKSNSEGKIKFLELDPNARFEYGIEELVNTQNPEDKYIIKEGQEVSDITNAIIIDISNLIQGTSSVNYKKILSSTSFNELAGNMDAGNKKSLAIAVSRNLKRLNLAGNEENIKGLTTEIIKARATFGNRVLFGNELEKLIFVGYSDVFSRHGMREMFQNSGIDASKITLVTNGKNDKQTVLNELATSTEATTFLFNGHGYSQGMALGGGRGRISYKDLANALEQRWKAGHHIENVNIMSFACYQYDNLHINLANELQRRGITEFPVMISQANRGVQSTTDWHYTVDALSNKPAGSSVKGQNFFGAERGRGDDPALSVPVKLNLGGGQERVALLEIS
jgi:hypothetical protein